MICEPHALQPPDAAYGAHLELHATLPAPTPLGDPDLEGRLRLMDKTLKWSRQATYSQAVMALGTAHLLAHLIEHPTQEAEALRAGLIEATEACAASSSARSRTENVFQKSAAVRKPL